MRAAVHYTERSRALATSLLRTERPLPEPTTTRLSTWGLGPCCQRGQRGRPGCQVAARFSGRFGRLQAAANERFVPHCAPTAQRVRGHAGAATLHAAGSLAAGRARCKGPRSCTTHPLIVGKRANKRRGRGRTRLSGGREAGGHCSGGLPKAAARQCLVLFQKVASAWHSAPR